MLIFCEFEIELFVEEVVARDNGPRLCVARDASAHQWLIVKVSDDPDQLAWLCVPASERAIEAFVSGRAAPRDVILHSTTGTVDLVVIDHGRSVPDSCLLCPDIPEYLLPADDHRLLAAA